MDPAALGTLRIGLDAIEAEARAERPHRSTTARASRIRPARVTLASVLRRIATVLDGRSLGEPAR